MSNRIRGVIISILIIIWTYFVCKNIENTKLKKQVKILRLLLITWIVLSVSKCDFIKNDNLYRWCWYLYYFPALFSSIVFLNIGTWHNRNKKYIKLLKNISFVAGVILFLIVITNDLHDLVFKIDLSNPDWEKVYTYGVGYYFCFIYIFINILISIFSTIKYSKGSYKKQKFIILVAMFFVVFSYAIGYIERIPVIFKNDFVTTYCIFYMLALIIIVYKEKYRLLLEENLYKEIEDAIKDKTILINKILNNNTISKDDLSYIKLLISYCKNKSNLIVLQKNKEYYASEELKLFIENIFRDVSNFGIYGAVNIVNRFEVSIYLISIIYDYINNLCEYSNKYKKMNILISIEKLSSFININTVLDTDEKLESFEYNFEMTQYMNNKNILEDKLLEDNILNMNLKIPINQSVLKNNILTEKENRVLLEVKSKVHDILGQRLTVVSKIVDENNIEEEKINELRPLLKNILNDLDNDKIINPLEMLNQIVYSCELAGAKLYVIGELPKNYIKAITLVKIIRECSTNAIRHANAENIYVEILIKDKVQMNISNDGNSVNTFCEGDGIKGIRKRVEELNGRLDIDTNENFSVKVVI